jgi:uncharacterized protein (TIGR00730 family)
MIVTVFGAAFLPAGGAAEEIARRTGEGIARRGWTVATGGYGGTMAAVSRGAAEAGGHTVGVTCEQLTAAGRRKNDWVGEEIRCATVRDRLHTLAEIGDAYIALDGGIGTLTEIAFCWNQIQVGELNPRPIVLIGTVWRESLAAFFRAAAPYIKEQEIGLLAFAASPEEALQAIHPPRTAE